MAFPARLSELTVDWLNQVFAARGLLGARRIVGFEAAPAARRGGTSSVHVLTLTCDQPADSVPGKVLVKFSSESEAIREVAREHRLYQREIAFYARLGRDPGIPTPACYASEYDERSNTCVLLLEYLEHTRSGEAQEGSPDDIEAAVRCLAPFHAKWWGQAAALPFIESEYSPASLESHMDKVGRALARIREGGHGGAIGEPSLAILELWLAQARTLADYARSRPQTMCHGSFHRGQILFSDQSERLPWVIDWQNVALNIGANDLARIVVTGLLPDQRRQHECRLVAKYHALLREHGVGDYSSEQLFDDYRLGLVNLIVFHSQILADYSVEVIARFWKGKDSFWDELFHWPGAAAEDADALGWLKEITRSRLGHR